MKRMPIVFVCVLACLLLLSGCRSNSSSSDDSAGAAAVEIDDSLLGPDGDISSEDSSEGGFTYSLKDPDNADGIVITPRE